MLTYKGEPQFKTHLRGIVSIFVFLMIFMYTVYLIKLWSQG